MAVLFQLDGVLLRELVHARMLFEIGAVSMVAARPRKSTLLELQNLLTEDSAAGRDMEWRTRLEVRFHAALLRGARNVTFATLFSLMSLLFDSVVREAYISTKRESSAISQDSIHDAHEALLGALVTKNVEEARTIWRDHRRRQLDEVSEMLGDTPLTKLPK
jgi:DNA-binding FadR family transcriptional regulator